MNNSTTQLCSVVLPVHNESENIISIFEAITNEFSNIEHDFEIIFIDDGSNDNSWEMIQNLTSQPHVQGIKLSRNFGKEAAIAAGLDHANGDAVIIMDADLQHPPKVISKMIRLWDKEGFDVVDCIKKDRGNESLLSSLGAKSFYFIFSKLSKLKLEGASDFKLISRQVVDAWSQMREYNLFFRGMSPWLGFKRAEVKFDVSERQRGRSSWSTFNLFRLAINSIIFFSSSLLQIITLMGAGFLLLAVTLGLYTLWRWYVGDVVGGFTTIYILQLTIGSFVMIALGIIGLYLTKIYDEVKKRPRYIVKKHIKT